MRKLPYRYRTPLFALLMSACTSLIVSGTVLALHRGFAPGFLQTWLATFALAWPVVFAAILALAPLIARMTDRLVESPRR